ncbi:hypothetical protein RFI_01242 [Reticulomyxa filosa]|uniref:Uncharacterized protein n=1 Tax=Reticulomyxa filosa TaxID=46433 RepID=X6PB92_RETFI|nr:hypothetical protein RFI_01242 [Reticulomyxa filosa]|eukprot:ETO35820.1 hypothetical protein RFI_01242 [Reticulomyxa filosa]
MACVVVESLKRQKIAKVVKIATNMNLNPNFARFGGSLAWGRPAPTIVFHLERGEFATYVSDYQQRKVIEIFEKHDTHHSGKLSKKVIEDLNLVDIFLANNEQVMSIWVCFYLFVFFLIRFTSGKCEIEKTRQPKHVLREEAKKYLENVEEVDLPLFIRYCSALIHPLLRMAVFRDKLSLLGVGPHDDNTHLNEE